MGTLYTNAVSPMSRYSVTWRVTDRGAVAGEPDSTAAIQAVIDSMQWGDVLDGPTGTFNVTTLRLRSGISVRNLALRSCSGSTDHVAPITIGDATGAQVLSDITIENVHVDGNREGQTDISGDGYRFGFCILGRAHRITIRNCSASYCATDGLFMYNGAGTVAAYPLFHDIEITDCTFEWNRRHGTAGTSVCDSTFTDCVFSYNGRDVGESAGIAGSFGVDFELEQPGQSCGGLRFTRCTARYNSSAGIVFSDHSTDSGYSDDLVFDTCTLGDNIEYTDNGALGFKYEDGSEKKKFRNVRVVSSTINGLIIGHCVDGMTVEGGTVTGQQLIPSYRAGSFVNCSNLSLTAQPQGLPWILSPTAPLCSGVSVAQSPKITVAHGGSYKFLLPSTMSAALRAVSAPGEGPNGITMDAQVSIVADGSVSATGEGSDYIGSTDQNACQFVTASIPGWGWSGWEVRNNTGADWTFSYSLSIA